MIISDAFALIAIADSCYLCATGKNYRPMIKINDRIMEDFHKNVTDIKFNKSEIRLARRATNYAINHIESYCKSNNANETKLGKRIATIHLKLAIKALNKRTIFI